MLTNRSHSARQNSGRSARSMSVSVDRVSTTDNPRRKRSARGKRPVPGVFVFSGRPGGKGEPGLAGTPATRAGIDDDGGGGPHPGLGLGRGGGGRGGGGGGGGRGGGGARHGWRN